MKFVLFVAITMTFVCGFYAAILWFRASKVDISIGDYWPKGYDGQPFAPLNPIDAQAGWLSAIQDSLKTSSSLNAQAAFWTGFAVVFGTITTILGTLS